MTSWLWPYACCSPGGGAHCSEQYWPAAAFLQVPRSVPWNRSICTFSGESLLCLFFLSPLFPLTHPASHAKLCLWTEEWPWLQIPVQTGPASPKENPPPCLGDVLRGTLSCLWRGHRVCCSSCLLIRPWSQGFQEEPCSSAVSQEAACPSQALPLPQGGDRTVKMK